MLLHARRVFTVLVAVTLIVTASASLIASRQANAQPNASVTLSPSSGLPGAWVTIRGSGFYEGSWVGAFWGNNHDFLTETHADYTGNVAFSFQVPSNAQPGTYLVYVTDDSHNVNAYFTVTSPNPVPTPTQPTDNIPPDGRWIEPAQGFEEGNDSLKLKAEAWDNPGGSGVAYVKFTAFFNSRWETIATVYPAGGSNVFEYTWTNASPIKMSSVPDGPLRLSFDVYPNQGNNASAPDGYRDGTVKRPTGPAPTITWPFRTDASSGQWAIINGYRGFVDHAPGESPNDYARFAFDFAKCPSGQLDYAAGICKNSNNNWAPTTGATVLSPVTGNVAWVDNACRTIAIDIDGAPGHRIVLAHVDGYPQSGKVNQGTPIGTVSAGGCTAGDHLHMALYTYPTAVGDFGNNRTAVPFTGSWKISGCDYPDNGNRHQYLDRLVPCGSKPPTGSIPRHVVAAIDNTWAYSDQAVMNGDVNRTWMWGPESFTGSMTEPYVEGLASTASADDQTALANQTGSGNRWVQYFDKARMEVTNPNEDSTSFWYVTNGLLVVEMVNGWFQTGDAEFDQSPQPANVNVAGDADDASGPTYATFTNLLHAAALPDRSVITQRVNRSGHVWEDASLAVYGVTAAERVQVPGIDHQIASPFWQFMNSSGLVYRNGQYITDKLFESPFYATGYPITEAYWATVKVGGTPTNVLMQCFERRCLTYTPSNDANWQVEAGNVGRHYYTWRYEANSNPPGPQAPPTPTGLTAVALDSTQIELSWNDTPNEYGYRLLDNGQPADRGPGTNHTSIVMDELEPGSTHCYQIQAFNTAGDSPWSSQACATTDSGSGPETKVYRVDFDDLNNSMVTASARIEKTGSELVIHLTGSGFEYGSHPIPITGHPGGQTASCPMVWLDSNSNGFIEWQESLPANGSVVLPLEAISVDESGTIDVSITIDLNSDDASLLGDLEDRVFLIMGMTADLNQFDDIGSEYVASLPVACGDINYSP